jgi:pimeloyl-ACP methyl ester carboxylesterase
MNNDISVFRSEFGERQILGLYDSIIESIGIPLEEVYIDTSLGNTHIIISGPADKPPIILVHAFYATAASWYQNLKKLSEEFRVFAIDIIGDPNKSKPIKLIRDSKDYVTWLNEIMRELKLDRADFIGNSVGAFHVVNFAFHSPEKVRRMILIGPAATFSQIFPFYINTFPGGITGWTWFVRHAVKWIENGVPFESKFHDLFCLTLKYGKSANQVFPRVFRDEELNRIHQPVLLIYGDREVIYNTKYAINRAQKHLKNIDVKIIPNANHITAASNAKSINDAFIDFLNQTQTVK